MNEVAITIALVVGFVGFLHYALGRIGAPHKQVWNRVDHDAEIKRLKRELNSMKVEA